MASPHRGIFSVFFLVFVFVSVPPWGLPPGSEALPPGSEALPPGSEALPPGSEALSACSEALTPGSEALPAGFEALPAGSGTLSAGSVALLAGSGTLLAGSEAPRLTAAQLPFLFAPAPSLHNYRSFFCCLKTSKSENHTKIWISFCNTNVSFPIIGMTCRVLEGKPL